MRALAMRSYLSTAARVCAIAAVIGCGDPGVIDDTLVVSLSDATSCRPASGVDRIGVIGRGDASSTVSVELRGDRSSSALPDAPFAILALDAVAEGPGWRAIGYRTRADRGDALLMLPPTLSCGVADPEARAPVGAATAVTSDGALFVAGGLGDDGIATRRVITLAPGSQTVEMEPLELASASAFASATALPDRHVLIAGGSIADDAPPYDTYEELALGGNGEGRVVGALAVRRRDHAAIALRDGRVLLVGGRGAAGAPLESIEIVDREARRGREADASLAIARVAPSLALDDRGRVWIAGGETGSSIALERFDPLGETIERFELELPRADALAFVPGGRLVWIAGARTFVVVLRDVPIASELRGTGVDVPDAQSVATPGAHVLLVGPGAAQLFDPGTGAISARPTSIASTALLSLGDRSIAELAPTGASIRREEEPTPYGELPAIIDVARDDDRVLRDPTDRDGEIWIDPRFEERDGELVALVPDARVDVRALRASRLGVEVAAEGPIELVLVTDGAPDIAIELDADELTVGGCTITRAAGAITIDPERVSSGTAGCPIASSGPFGIAVRAREIGARMRSISIVRR